MMQHLTRTQLYWMRNALIKAAKEYKAAANDENSPDWMRSCADLQGGNLERICDILKTVAGDPKALRIAID